MLPLEPPARSSDAFSRERIRPAISTAQYGRKREGKGTRRRRKSTKAERVYCVPLELCVVSSSDLQPKKPLRILVQDLLQIRIRQSDILDQSKGGCGIPARIVGAIHHPIDTIVVDGKFDAHGMRRNGVCVHPSDICAWRPRKLCILAVLIHPARLVRQRSAGVGHHHLEPRMPLHQTGKHEARSRHTDFNDASKAELQSSAVACQVLTKYGIRGMKEYRYAQLFDASVKGCEPVGIDPRVATDASRNIDTHQSESSDSMVKNFNRHFRIG